MCMFIPAGVTKSGVCGVFEAERRLRPENAAYPPKPSSRRLYDKPGKKTCAVAGIQVACLCYGIGIIVLLGAFHLSFPYDMDATS